MSFLKGNRLFVFGILIIALIVNLSIAMDYNPGCKQRGSARAKLWWVNQEEPGPSITLHAGPCGEGGDTAKGYILMASNDHQSLCNNNTTPCSGYDWGCCEPGYGQSAENLTVAVIKITGDQKAFSEIFGGITFHSDACRLIGEQWYHAIKTVTETGKEFELAVNNAATARIMIIASVINCEPEHKNAHFGIQVTFYDGREAIDPDDNDCLSALTSAKGSIHVKMNKTTGENEPLFRPDPRSGSCLAGIKELTHNYETDSEFSLTIQQYDSEESECESVEVTLGPAYICPNFEISSSGTFYTCKVPGWQEEVNVESGAGLPIYMVKQGMSYNESGNYFVRDQGDLGKTVYHLGYSSSSGDLLSSVEHCDTGENPGQGDTQWTVTYGAGDKLASVSDGSSQTYAYSWSTAANGNDVATIKFPNLTQPEREWEVELDDQNRPVRVQGGCSSGCSGIGEYEHIAYYDPEEEFDISPGDRDYASFQDLIKSRYASASATDPVEEFSYLAVPYGEYVPGAPVWVDNASFAYPEVSEGNCQGAGGSIGWTVGTPANVEVCNDVNDIFPDGDDQYLHLVGSSTLSQTLEWIQEKTRYTLGANIRTNNLGTPSATIELYSTNPLFSSSPLITLTYTGDDWVEDYWESDTYEDDGGTYYNWASDRLKLKITAQYVDIDNIQLLAEEYVEHKVPRLVDHKILPEGSQQLVSILKRNYNTTNSVVTEHKQIESAKYQVTQTTYTDASFMTWLSRTEFTNTVFDDTSIPSEPSYVTTHDPNHITGYAQISPNEKRKDVQVFDTAGNVTDTYTEDTDTKIKYIHQNYVYADLFFVVFSGGGPQWEVTEQTDARGNVTEYEYEYVSSRNLFRLKKVLHPPASASQRVTVYEYNGDQQVTKEIEGTAKASYPYYDIVKTRQYNYNTQGLLYMTIEDKGGIHAKTQYMYNSLGDQIRQIDPDGVATGKTYGQGGQVISEFVVASVSDPNDSDSQLILLSQTCYEFDDDGRLVKVKKALDEEPFLYNSPDDWAVTKYEYNPQGRKTKMVEDYDDLGQRLNLETSYEYDMQGRLTKTTYPTGRWVKIERDGRGLVTREVVGYGETEVYDTEYTYDINGNLNVQTNPDGTILVHIYDNIDRLEKTFKGDTSGPYTFRAYDTAGSMILEQAIDPNGIMLSDRRNGYDEFGRLYLERTVFDPNSPDDTTDVITTYSYDKKDNLIKVIREGVGSSDPNGMIETNDEVIQYSYDLLDRKIQMIDPEGIYSMYTYSDAGRLLVSIDPNIPDPNQLFTTVHSYDEAGRLKQTTNPEGDYTVFSYNSLNQLIKQVVWDCNSTMDYTPDDVSVRQVRYAYNRLGKRTREVVMEDPASTETENVAIDQVTDWIYDPNSGLLSETRTYYGTGGTAAITNYYYDQIGRNWRTIDPEGNEAREYYDATNGVQVIERQQFEKDPADSNNDYTVTVFYDYDDYGNLYKRTLDENGDETKDGADPATWYYYDDLNRLEKQVGPDGVATFYKYDSFGNVSQTIEDYDPGNSEALNKTTETVFDRLNRQIQVIAYDPNDTTTHIAEQITEYEYNKRGQISKILYPDSTYIQYIYNNLRQVDEEVRRDGTSIFYWYDRLGNVVAESDDEDLIAPTFLTEYDFDAAGNLLWCVKEEDGQAIAESAFVYNGLGLPESETTTLYDLDSKTTTFTYDGSGNILTQMHNNETFTYTYDGLGRIETIDRGEDEIVAYSYIGTATKAIDYTEADTTWQAYYDDLGRMTECVTIDPNDDTLLDLFYTYDENSNRDSVQYKHIVPNVWDIYTYDTLQRLVKAEYGSSSGLARLDDYIGDVQFAAAVGSRWLISQESFLQLAQMQVSEIRDKQKQVHQALVKTGLDEVVKKENGGQMPVVALADFGESSDKKDENTYQMLRNDDGKVVAIVILDAEGRLTLLAMYPDIGGTVIASITYDEEGNVTSKICSTYDTNGVLVDQIDLLALDQQQALVAGSTTSSSKRRIPATSSVTGRSIDTSLDGGMVLPALSGVEMMSMSTPEGPAPLTEEFEYDHLGNRYQYTDKNGFVTAYSHNHTNQYEQAFTDLPLVPDQTLVFSYDANGNLSEDGYGDGYSYDYRNRLIEVEDPNSNSVVEFRYDALGRRVRKQDIETGITTYFFYDLFGRVIAEYERPSGGSTAWARSFVYGNGIDEVLGMFLPEHAGDPEDWEDFGEFVEAWLCQDPGDACYDAAYDHNNDDVVDLEDFAYFASVWDVPDGKETRFYYLKDPLGSTIGLVGGRYQRESDREFYLYDVYGQPSQDSLPSAAGNPYLFTGRRYDPEVGLYYFRARHYDPSTGRFLQTDPISYADSMNLYEYVTSNPFNFIDPLGLQGGVDIRMDNWIEARTQRYFQEKNKLDDFQQKIQRMNCRECNPVDFGPEPSEGSLGDWGWKRALQHYLAGRLTSGLPVLDDDWKSRIWPTYGGYKRMLNIYFGWQQFSPENREQKGISEYVPNYRQFGTDVEFSHKSKWALRFSTNENIGLNFWPDLVEKIEKQALNAASSLSQKQCLCLTMNGDNSQEKLDYAISLSNPNDGPGTFSSGRSDEYSEVSYNTKCCLKKECKSAILKCRVRINIKDLYTWDNYFLAHIAGKDYWQIVHFDRLIEKELTLNSH
ncbi:MAG: RHS repeat-associated core domain-containing protein [Sedimentisphaerales bacterium]|nr:RHS repeat-associated core domain-containing protein [Sedimentisphaerales bacterium]